MKLTGSEWVTRQRPITAGEGWRFVEVGELIRDGDEFFNVLGQWRPTTQRRVVCSAQAKNLYRRRAAA